ANTATSAGSALVTAASMSCAVVTLTTATPGGSGTLTGPETSVTSAPASAAGAAVAWPCLPGERLAVERTGSSGSGVGAGGGAPRRGRRGGGGGGGANTVALARPSAVPDERQGGRRNLERFGHAPDAGLARLRHLAGVRPDQRDAVLEEAREIALRRLVLPHVRVHCRRQQHLAVGGDEHGTGEIVGVPAGELGHEIGGRRRRPP